MSDALPYTAEEWQKIKDTLIRLWELGATDNPWPRVRATVDALQKELAVRKAMEEVPGWVSMGRLRKAEAERDRMRAVLERIAEGNVHGAGTAAFAQCDGPCGCASTIATAAIEGKAKT